MTRSHGMVIIGGGIAAFRAANTLRDEGWNGAITLVSDEQHVPYDRPPLSKSFVTDAEAPAPTLVDIAALASNGVDFVSSNAATRIDRFASTVRLSDGQSLPYEKLLIATGAQPRRLTLPGSDSARVHYLRTIEDSLAIKGQLKAGAHMLVIGGGFIGLEIACSARKLGARVTVIEGLPRILSRGVPLEVAKVVANRHRQEGVALHCDAKITQLVESDDAISVTLADGQTITGDLVVAGIGAQPVTDLASNAGLAIENGIRVDSYLQTSDPDILAAGDCVSFPLAACENTRVRLESWRNAQDQGVVAAANMLGKQQAYEAIPWFWSDQYNLSLQIVGLRGAQDRFIRRNLGDDAFILFHLDHAGRLTGASGIGVGNAVARDIRLTEMLIAKGAMPPEQLLADDKASLKALLRQPG